MSVFRKIIRVFEGIGYLFLKMEPDSVKLPRIEAEIAEKEAHAIQALEQFGALIAADERAVAAKKPAYEQMEAQIQQLLASGNEAAAEGLMPKFDDLETEYKEISARLESNRAALKVEYEQTQRDIEKLRKLLSNIKEGAKRAAAEEKLNELRKAASGQRFEAAGLTDDLASMQEKINERRDKVRGTRMVLDLATEKSAAELANDKAAEKADNQARLARFATNRGMQLKSVEKVGAAAPLGSAPAEEVKEQA